MLIRAYVYFTFAGVLPRVKSKVKYKDMPHNVSIRELLSWVPIASGTDHTWIYCLPGAGIARLSLCRYGGGHAGRLRSQPFWTMIEARISQKKI